ncbi:MAG: hypothetical protein A2Z52_02000, partial [Candidatus Moranbacteria bacterium RBG_19FT_COMBO_42_6]
MDIVKKLEEMKKRVNPEIDKYFERVIKETEKVDKNITEAVKYVRRIVMSGGKRARAIFMYYGYLAAGGREFEKIIKTSASIELIHAFLLIHDDIIDQDAKRHGVTTIHEHYKAIGSKFLKNKDPKHFGNSMAIIIGDMVGALGNQIIFESKFKPKRVIQALHRLQGIVSFTVVGQTEDIYIENKGKATEKEIMKMYENKTAKYTIEGPLHLGAILAGADEKFLKALSEYSIPVGIAFQIQDDILGVFGDEKKLGKSVGSDIRQGKQTILVAKAFEKADSEQRKILSGALGKKDLTMKDLENFRKVIINTGSLDYAKKLSAKMVEKGKSALANHNPGVKIKKEA